jgi:hypothetical protein
VLCWHAGGAPALFAAGYGAWLTGDVPRGSPGEAASGVWATRAPRARPMTMSMSFFTCGLLESGVKRRWQESNPPDGDHPSHSF